MKNVSSSNGNEKYPKLRFPEFKNQWKAICLGDAIKQNLNPIPRPEHEYTRLGIYCHAKGTFHELVPIEKALDVDTMYLVEKDNLIVNITFAWEHAIAITSNNDEGKVVSHRFPTYAFTKEHCSSFYKYLILKPRFKYELGVASPGGAGRNRVLNKNAFLEIPINIPSLEEQNKIAAFMQMIDKRIEKQEALVAALKKYKRGLSKKLFNEVHNDTTCVVKQFSEVFELLQNNTFSRECLTNETTEILNIHYGDILVKYGSVVDLDIDVVPFINNETDTSKFKSSSYLQDGDVIFADTAEDYTVGKMCEIINASNRKILSGLHTMPYRPTITFAPMYLGHYLNSAAFRTQILPMIQGAKVSSISKGEIKKTIVYIPSIDCQRKIVSILNTLDKRIKKAEVVHNELKQMKQGLLQNLFM